MPPKRTTNNKAPRGRKGAVKPPTHPKHQARVQTRVPTAASTEPVPRTRRVRSRVATSPEPARRTKRARAQVATSPSPTSPPVSPPVSDSSGRAGRSWLARLTREQLEDMIETYVNTGNAIGAPSDTQATGGASRGSYTTEPSPSTSADPAPIAGSSMPSSSASVPPWRAAEDNFQPPLTSDLRLWAQVLRAPRAKLPTFDGNPLEFHDFIRAFESQVEPWMETEAAKWATLVSQCKGEAADALKACSFVPQAHRYEAAKTLLHKKYGTKEVVEQAWMTHLQTPMSSIEKLSVSLDAAVQALEATTAARYADHHLTLHAIQRGFPEALQRKWGTELLKRRERGEEPTLAFLAEVVRKFADRERQWQQLTEETRGRSRSNTRWDRAADAPRRAQRPPSRRREAAACYAAAASQPRQTRLTNNITTSSPQPRRAHTIDQGVTTPPAPPRCYICDAAHRPHQCSTLKEMSVDERYIAVKKGRACYRCLEQGHLSRQCKHYCRTCRGGHHTLLHHDSRPIAARDNKPSTTQADSYRSGPAAGGHRE